MTGVIDMVVLSLLVVVALAVAQTRNLFAAVMLTGLYSLLSAAWMTVLDAPDVAYTEAAVGAGISTVLMLATLSLTTEEEEEPSLLEPGPLFVALITGIVLLYATLDMPAFGDPNSPVHQHVAPHYLYESPHEVGVPNIITAVLASYRGFDTLGETTVVLAAAVGVLAMLSGPPPAPAVSEKVAPPDASSGEAAGDTQVSAEDTDAQPHPVTQPGIEADAALPDVEVDA